MKTGIIHILNFIHDIKQHRMSIYRKDIYSMDIVIEMALVLMSYNLSLSILTPLK